MTIAHHFHLHVELLTVLPFQIDENWDSPSAIVPTKRDVDAATVPFSFHWPSRSFLSVVGLNLIWSSKIVLSGLCQTLASAGNSISWPSLSEMLGEERRCAMCIAMSADYFASLAPYGALVGIMYLQFAWGVYWRQSEGLEALGICADGIREWLRRRGNESLELVDGNEMNERGLAMYTAMLMGMEIPAG